MVLTIVLPHLNELSLEALSKLDNRTPCHVIDPQKLRNKDDKATVRAILCKNVAGWYVLIKEKQYIRKVLSRNEIDYGDTVLKKPPKGEALFRTVEELFKKLEELDYEIS